MAAWSLENVGENYAILAEDYAFGQSTAAGFMASFGALGATFNPAEPIFAPSDTTDFNTRDRELLQLLSTGHTTEEIAALRHRSPATVRNQLSALYQKLGVTRRTEAVAKLQTLGLQPIKS